jgi:hypothetical protein
MVGFRYVIIDTLPKGDDVNSNNNNNNNNNKLVIRKEILISLTTT